MMKTRLAILALLLTFALVDLSAAQTFLHRDFGGVSRYSGTGNVLLNVRNDGRVRTSVRVGNTWFHNGNDGITGLSHEGRMGRLDVFSQPNRTRPTGWYTPWRNSRLTVPSWSQPFRRGIGDSPWRYPIGPR